MKKKKDTIFDQLKSEIMKPLKDIPTQFKDYFGSRAAIWAPQDFASLNEQFFSHPKIASYLKEKRLQQVNKEYKASCERFKELTDKVGKKYGQMNLRGF